MGGSLQQNLMMKTQNMRLKQNWMRTSTKVFNMLTAKEKKEREEAERHRQALLEADERRKKAAWIQVVPKATEAEKVEAARKKQIEELKMKKAREASLKEAKKKIKKTGIPEGKAVTRNAVSKSLQPGQMRKAPKKILKNEQL